MTTSFFYQKLFALFLVIWQKYQYFVCKIVKFISTTLSVFQIPKYNSNIRILVLFIVKIPNEF